MTPILDIFKMNHTGELRWLEFVKNIEDAKARLVVLGIGTISVRPNGVRPDI